MDIIGDRRFVEIPGGKTHELPPLLVKTAPEVKRLDVGSPGTELEFAL